MFPGLNSFDGGIMSFVQAHFHNAFTDRIFPFITYLGEAGCFWILLLTVMLFFKRARRCGVLGLCAMAMGLVLGEGLIKNLVCRPRPFADYPNFCELLISPPSGFSFPSGHTCASFAAAVTIFLHYKKPGILALILASLIGFSRIFLFVHYPTDVLAGALLGIVSALAVCSMALIIHKRRSSPKKTE